LKINNFNIQTEQWGWTTGNLYFDFLQVTRSFLLHIQTGSEAQQVYDSLGERVLYCRG